VSKRRQRALGAVAAAPGLERPEHERLLLMVPQNADTVQAAILRMIGKRTTDIGTRENVVIRVLPPHGKRRQMPVVRARNTGAVGVG
jgi:hypothetical protein